jgi:hypothetical protein
MWRAYNVPSHAKYEWAEPSHGAFQLCYVQCGWTTNMGAKSWSTIDYTAAVG